YHMNKKHWLTIPLDGTVPIGEICSRLDQSYILAKK
ncbi:MAG: MmcQ/YjbR family DNA-binding protein, partial [Clostridia bacterium]|nr:MmcQ/YjbR family DNA-binding protein [Clostridia bacterium]